LIILIILGEEYKLFISNRRVKKKGKAVPVTGREGPWGCETWTFSLQNRLTDGGMNVSLMRRLPFKSLEHSWYSFLLQAESIPGPYCGWNV
jgi:hypothetical protein